MNNKNVGTQRIENCKGLRYVNSKQTDAEL